jgi:hypothetical protein
MVCRICFVLVQFPSLVIKVVKPALSNHFVIAVHVKHFFKGFCGGKPIKTKKVPLKKL